MEPAFPLEIFGRLIEYLDKRNDLLHFALTNSTYLAFAQPWLSYRDIRTQLNHADLWAKLSSESQTGFCYHAQRVRSLTIICYQTHGDFGQKEYYPEDNLRIPPDVPRPPYEDVGGYSKALLQESERMLVRALRQMARLETFTWHRSPAPVLTGEEGVWDALVGLGTVRTLDVYEHGDDADNDDESEWPRNLGVASELAVPFSGAAFLTTFRFQSGAQDPNLDFTAIETMALVCTSLETLDIDLNPANWIIRQNFLDAEALFSRGHWPSLRDFGVKGVKASSEALRTFCERHPLLERLRLPAALLRYDWRTWVLPAHALPNLRVLCCTSAQAVAFLASDADQRRRPISQLVGVEFYETIRWEEYTARDVGVSLGEESGGLVDVVELKRERVSPWRALLLERLENHPTITRVDICSFWKPDDLWVLAETIPQLKGLGITFEYDERRGRVPSISSDIEEEMIGLYSRFPSLEAIKGLPLSPDGVSLPSRWRNRDYSTRFKPLIHHLTEMASRLQSVCPQLRAVEVWQAVGWDITRGKIVILDEDSEAEEDEEEPDKLQKGVNTLRWVGREPWEDDLPRPHDGEVIYE